MERSYILTDEQDKYVKSLADKMGWSRSQVIRLAVMNLAELTDVAASNGCDSRRELVYEFEGIAENFELKYT